MRWDSLRILPVVHSDNRPRAKVLWLSSIAPSDALLTACHLAAIDLVTCGVIDVVAELLFEEKPDLIIYDDTHIIQYPDLCLKLQAHRVTENLALLPCNLKSTIDEQTIGTLGAHTSIGNYFITIRSALRRERPIAIKDIRRSEAFILDSAQFRFCRGDRCAMISSSDHCLIGPLFDIPEAVLDQSSLSNLVFGNMDTSSRVLGLRISRLRQRIKQQIGVDPIRTVNSFGYSLAGESELSDIWKAGK